MSSDRFLSYRGDLRSIAIVDGVVAFVTVHPEGQPTAIYRVDPDKLTPSTDPLAAGGADLLPTPEGLWVAGTDGQLYVQTEKGNATARGPRFEPAPVALAALAAGRLAVGVGDTVRIVSRSDGKELQSLQLSEAVTCLCSDVTGQWLAAGGVKGTVAIFESETDPATFQQSDAATLHDAAVTALLFEADELRILSAGADQKLLSTHARGRLEAEDRGRGFMHEQPIVALAAGPGGRFFSGSADSSLKSWPPGKGGRPITKKDEVGKVVDLAVVLVHDKPQLVVACADNTLRFFHLDEEGKFELTGHRVHGIAGWAKHELAGSDPNRRDAALRRLADFADIASIDFIAKQMGNDTDPALRLLACRLLGESKHPRAHKVLEQGLRHRDQAVRIRTFDGLRGQVGPDDLRPIALALKTDKADVGCRAVEALEGLAKNDGRAMAQLVEALDANSSEVRKAALTALEKVHAPDSPEASLVALGSSKADVRRLALVRLFQRRLLHDPRVQGALRWRGDDADPEVRRVAFLLSLYTRERLVQALRQRDPDLHRQLTELEEGTLPTLRSLGTTEAAPESDRNEPDAVADIIAKAEELVRLGQLPAHVVEYVKRAQSISRDTRVLDQLKALLEQLAERGRKS
jgi:ParB family transcriptional regulator, chromosome partitioning protein